MKTQCPKCKKILIVLTALMAITILSLCVYVFYANHFFDPSAVHSTQEWGQYFDEKYLSLSREIAPSRNLEFQLPYTITYGAIGGNPLYELVIRIDLMVNKEDALNVGKTGQKELLTKIYNQIKQWIIVNYSDNQHYRAYVRIFIPDGGVYMARLHKTESSPGAPAVIDFSNIPFLVADYYEGKNDFSPN